MRLVGTRGKTGHVLLGTKHIIISPSTTGLFNVDTVDFSNRNLSHLFIDKNNTAGESDKHQHFFYDET